jgi:hypothetical protein
MQTKQITSVKDADNPKPWYEIDLSNAPPEITQDNDGGTDHDTASASIESINGADADNPSQDVVYAVTEGGRYICSPRGYDLSQDGISLRAHLAWYDADADEFTVLEFVDTE